MTILRSILAATLLWGCQINEIECDRECQDSWLDGRMVFDTTGRDSLLSKRLPNPGSAALAKPVILAIHGFTASTFEWKEFKRYADVADTGVLVSLVLLGGHGTDIEQFRTSTWQSWGKPILDEYQALWNLGYRNIHLVGSSTACPLILQHVRAGAFRDKEPGQIVFIDPIVVPSAKLLTAVNLFGPILGNSPNPGTEIEKRHWYTNRPAEALAELYEVVNAVKQALESGFRLPAGSRMKVFKSVNDASADPVGALLLYKGLRHSDGTRIEAEMVESRLHVFTRLEGRNGFSEADLRLQQKTFAEILARVAATPP